ncbi:hypothetical protein [Streptomyces sp. NPDC087525]|uniref:hypothetical protein n=1 Tax=Streptomyces sp. NPDC087525 TaxID=3365793 RepID=UPI0037FFAA4E
MPADGCAEGIADAVLVNIATYQAAAFPLPPGGLTEEERDARRTPAYRVAAVDGLPSAVRVSAVDALNAVDQGRDTDHAQAAMDALFLTVYEHRRIRYGSSAAFGDRVADDDLRPWSPAPRAALSFFQPQVEA